MEPEMLGTDFNVTSFGDWLKLGFIGLAGMALVMGVRMFKAANRRLLDTNGFRLAIAFLIGGLIVCAMGLSWSLIHEDNEQKITEIKNTADRQVQDSKRDAEAKIQEIKNASDRQVQDAKRDADVDVQKMRASLVSCAARLNDQLKDKEGYIAQLQVILGEQHHLAQQETALNNIRQNLQQTDEIIKNAINERLASANSIPTPAH
jgi:hypothetical protein